MKHKMLVISAIFSLLCSGCFSGLNGGKEISTKEELMELINDIKASGDYQLKNDIDLGGETINKADDTNGSYLVIKGNGHKISNAIIMSSYNASLFGKIGGGTAFSDITFDNIKVIGKNPAIIASSSEGGKYSNIVINENCSIGDGTSDNAGGLVAVSKVDKFEQCVNKANVTGLSNVGGIVGNATSTINNCQNYGAITGYGKENIGGIAGIASDLHTEKVTSSSNYGEVTSLTASFVGGVAGTFSNDRDEKDYETVYDGNKNYGNVKGCDGVGGVAGRALTHKFSSLVQNPYPNSILITNSSNSGTVIGKNSVGGIVGQSLGNPGSSNSKKYTISYSFCSNLLNDARNNYIQGEYHIGGIAGNGCYFKNCNNEVPLQMVESSDKSLTDSETVHKHFQFGIGGITGETSSSFACEFSACNNSADIKGYRNETNKYVGVVTSLGGIAGLCYGGSFVLCNSSGLLDGYGCVGGMIGSLLPSFESSMSSPKFTGTLNIADSGGGLIGYVEIAPDHKSTMAISGAFVDMKEVKDRLGYLGGYIGYAYSSSESNNDYYERISIINSSSSYTYYKKESTSVAFIQADVGFNDVSLDSKKTVVLDDTSKQNASYTLLGSITGED